MAQDFERVPKVVGNSASTILTSNSDDTVIGVHCANVTNSQITADIFVTVSGVDYYWIKNAPIPAGSAIQVIDGGAKFVLQSGDILKAQASAASSLHVWTSLVDAISE
tara:strand:+ start:1047 stop:1370 length:324 start_codon:yes stop_codon:yes gene_type:complete